MRIYCLLLYLVEFRWKVLRFFLILLRVVLRVIFILLFFCYFGRGVYKMFENFKKVIYKWMNGIFTIFDSEFWEREYDFIF